MKSRVILTVNFNQALCDNSRDSMKAAAARWGAEFVEFNEEYFSDGRPAVSPASLKCFCMTFLPEMEEFFILDADIVVSSLCPNPFDEFDDRRFIAVANGSGRFADLWQIRSCEQYEWGKLAAEEPRVAGTVYQAGAYWNSGMMLAKCRYHKEMFDLVSDIVQTDHGLGWNDQTPLNMSALACGIEIGYAPESWNYIHPYMLGDGWGDMANFPAIYIYHGAGEPDRINWLPVIKWA